MNKKIIYGDIEATKKKNRVCKSTCARVKQVRKPNRVIWVAGTTSYLTR